MTTPSGSDLFADARQATTTARGRLYEWKGDTYWSVTTLIDAMRKPGVENWTPLEVAKFAVANHRQLSAMVASVRMEHIDKRLEPTMVETIRGLFGLRQLVRGPRGGEKEPGSPIYIVREDPDAIAAAVSWLSQSPYRSRERKADIGTAVHAELEAYALDKPRPEPGLMVRPYIEQFRRFLDAYHPTIVLAEANCYNRTEAYAGRLDALMRWGDPELLWLVDYTTGKDVYAQKGYQCAAYARAEFVGLRDGTELPMPKVDAAGVVRLSEDDWEFRPVDISDATFRDFRLIRENFDILERRSKRIVGPHMATPEAANFLAVGGEAPAMLHVDTSAEGFGEPTALPLFVEREAEPVE